MTKFEKIMFSFAALLVGGFITFIIGAVIALTDGGYGLALSFGEKGLVAMIIGGIGYCPMLLVYIIKRPE